MNDELVSVVLDGSRRCSEGEIQLADGTSVRIEED
jgi:hypothetical protein